MEGQENVREGRDASSSNAEQQSAEHAKKEGKADGAVDAVKVAKAVRALLRRQQDPGALSAKEIRRKIESKQGWDLSAFKEEVKQASVAFVLSL